MVAGILRARQGFQDGAAVVERDFDLAAIADARPSHDVAVAGFLAEGESRAAGGLGGGLAEGRLAGRHVEVRTHERTLSVMRIHVLPQWGSWPLANIDQRAVQQWVNGPSRTDFFERLLPATAPNYRALAALAAGTGLRWGEAAGLAWGALDLDAGAHGPGRRRVRGSAERSKVFERERDAVEHVVMHAAGGLHFTTYGTRTRCGCCRTTCR